MIEERIGKGLRQAVYIIVSPFVIYFLTITLCVFRFTDCDYSFGISKLNTTSEYIIDRSGRAYDKRSIFVVIYDTAIP
jgi:hypothetical protein